MKPHYDMVGRYIKLAKPASDGSILYQQDNHLFFWRQKKANTFQISPRQGQTWTHRYGDTDFALTKRIEHDLREHFVFALCFADSLEECNYLNTSRWTMAQYIESEFSESSLRDSNGFIGYCPGKHHKNRNF